MYFLLSVLKAKCLKLTNTEESTQEYITTELTLTHYRANYHDEQRKSKSWERNLALPQISHSSFWVTVQITTGQTGQMKVFSNPLTYRHAYICVHTHIRVGTHTGAPLLRCLNLPGPVLGNTVSLALSPFLSPCIWGQKGECRGQKERQVGEQTSISQISVIYNPTNLPPLSAAQKTEPGHF